MVEQNQFPVRNPAQDLHYPFLCLCVQWKVRGDHVVVEIAKIFINVVFQQADLLIVQIYGNVCLAVYGRGKRIEQYLLRIAQLVEKHQYPQFPGL